MNTTNIGPKRLFLFTQKQKSNDPVLVPAFDSSLTPAPSPDSPSSTGYKSKEVCEAKSISPKKTGAAELRSSPKSGAAQDDPMPLGITRNLPPTDPVFHAEIPETAERITPETRKQKLWDLFHRAKKRAWSEFSNLKEVPDHPWVKILNSSPFACRCGAASRAGTEEDGKKAVSIGYAQSEIAWLGTYKCGSARFCPVCGAAIAAKNQKDVEQGIITAISKGYACLLATYTIPHMKTQTALDSAKKFSKARNLAGKGGDMSRWKKKMGYIGSIVRQEETYGANGWHPHTHDILIFDHFLSENEIEEIQAQLKGKWHSACKKLELIPKNRTKAFDEHGFDLQKLCTPKQIAEYISKIGWKDSSNKFKDKAKKEVLENSAKQIKGMAHEVSAHDSKAPRGAEGRTPWDILEGFAAGNWRDTNLWMEYMEAYFGKPLMRWSPGLKELLGIKDKNDEEKVNADEDDIISRIYYVVEDQYRRGVVRHGLWLPILEAIDLKDFERLQEISDEYAIDFRSCKNDDEYPEILSVRNVAERRKFQEKRDAARRRWEIKVEAERIVVEEQSRKKALKDRDTDYELGLLEPTMAAQVRADRLKAVKAKALAKKEARRRKRELEKAVA